MTAARTDVVPVPGPAGPAPAGPAPAGSDRAGRPRPHDLLRLAPGAPLRGADGGSAPAWLDDAPAPGWVVVRRAAPGPAGEIPVGVRGRTRDQRWAALVAPSAVVGAVAPHDLPRAPADPGRGALAVLQVLARLAPALDRHLGRAWGPTGSVGFELATGCPTARDGSDLDLVVRAPARVGPGAASALAVACGGDLRDVGGVRVDVLLETPHGGVSLDEWSRAGGRGAVALRTPTGPRLVLDPWEAP